MLCARKVGTAAARNVKEFMRTLCVPKLTSRTHVWRVLASGYLHISRPSSTSATKTQASSAFASLKKRGLYEENVFKHGPTSVVKNINIEEKGKILNVTWEDDHVSRFHAIWLRHGCHCQDCRLDHNGKSTVDVRNIDVDNIRVVSATMADDMVLQVTWEDTTNNITHEGVIPAAWLRYNCYSETAERDRRAQRAMKFPKDKVIPEMDYQELDQSEHAIYKWLKHISDTGLCLLKNVPTEDGMVAKVAERIAPVQHSIYGEIFRVMNKPEPINPAYSPVKLEFHMDQCYYESPPGVQLLHCIQFDPSIVGGENTFADIHEIVLKMREQKPEYFETLARVPMTLQAIHYSRDVPVHIRTQRPLISLNHKNELTAVFWHPPSAGPLQVAAEDVEPFYQAYKYMYEMLSSYQSVVRDYKLRMVAGDCICLLNRRLVHGRESFFNQHGVRHLQGTYVEITEFQSRIQVLHNLLGEGQLATRCGSLDWQ